MRTIIVDCEKVLTVSDFWSAYVAAAAPEGREYFGRNLDAFWDAVGASGPGWPGEDCEVRFINTSSIKVFQDGKFYDRLKDIAADSEFVPIYVE